MVSTRDARDFPGEFSNRLPTCRDDCDHAPPIDGRCNAHTRARRLCSHVAGLRTDHRGQGRCFLHGGRTPRGRSSPHFKHGLDSDYVAQQDNEALALHRAVTFVQELAQDLRGLGPIEVLWRMRSMSESERSYLAAGLERMAAGGWILK